MINLASNVFLDLTKEMFVSAVRLLEHNAWRSKRVRFDFFTNFEAGWNMWHVFHSHSHPDYSRWLHTRHSAALSQGHFHYVRTPESKLPQIIRWTIRPAWSAQVGPGHEIGYPPIPDPILTLSTQLWLGRKKGFYFLSRISHSLNVELSLSKTLKPHVDPVAWQPLSLTCWCVCQRVTVSLLFSVSHFVLGQVDSI